ncbi:hypothetical protein PIB30_049344 [Stylosanthes scabra]|uniref:Uncharacterized protein n=1 Tax=Stylosanthes scabra TaxID=79078 RepID=A0ABU6QGV0_9FABA|nr:hypothetical protein [Stylosanthes scabra]
MSSVPHMRWHYENHRTDDVMTHPSHALNWLQFDQKHPSFSADPRNEDFKKLKQVNKRNRASSMGGSLHTEGSTTYEATRERMSEVFARTHTRKEDREWVDKLFADVNDAYDAELKTLQDKRQAIIDARGPEPPPSTRPLYHDDDDIASGPPDLREQVTLLNREITQHAEAHTQRIAAAEAVCAEKMRSGGSGSGAMPDMPPPPPPPPQPPPAPSQTPPPQHDQSTRSPYHDDDTDYV